MTWTAPITWTTGQVVTAAQMNAQVRDNMLETAAATAAAAGDIVYADAVNSMGSRLAIGAAGARLLSTGTALAWRAGPSQSIVNASYISQTDGGGAGSSLSYNDFSGIQWSSGTTIAVTITTNTEAQLWYGARNVRLNTAGKRVFVAYRVSGATTVAASDVWATIDESSAANDENSPGRSHIQTGLTAGSNTFTLRAKTDDTAVTATVFVPYLIVQAL